MTELVCDSVTVNLNSLQILRDVSFRLDAGSIVGLVGPNGAGKTTLLNVMAGKIAPSKGEVRLDGKPISHIGRRHLAAMGVFRSFQEGRLFESLTAEENVVAAIQPPADERLSTALLTWKTAQTHQSQVRSTLEAVDVGGDRNVPAWKMSYGMRKRTVMGQAVAAHARVYLLDEPLAGVDAA
jgi:ABC-type branched-subunit amino acid transport system ATPase component